MADQLNFWHADAPHPSGLLRARRERPRSRAAEQSDELAASHMPSKPWDRDIAPERYHIQTLRLIRICMLWGSDAIRCLIGMGLSAACAERKQAAVQPLSRNVALYRQLVLCLTARARCRFHVDSQSARCARVSASPCSSSLLERRGRRTWHCPHLAEGDMRALNEG
jgi:hypothetical protein